MKQNVRLLSDETVLKLFNLNPTQVQSINILSDRKSLDIAITLNPAPHACPVCENTTQKIKGYATKKILHTVITHMPCYIVYRSRRYECTVCKKTFNEHNPFSYKNMKLSALTVSNILEALKNEQETFTTVAKRFRLSPTTVSTIFDTHVSISRRRLPEYLNIDECHAFDDGSSGYICVLVDAVDNNVIDVMPSRKKADLQRYFSQIPLEERERVNGICMDMWDTYRIIAKQYLPNAVIAVDRYHIHQEFQRRLNKIRVDIANSIKPPKNWRKTENKEQLQEYRKRSSYYYLMKKFSWILVRNSKATTKASANGKTYNLLDPNVPKQYNRTIGRFLNYYDILHLMLDYSPILEEAYWLGRDLESFYNDSNLEDAKEKLEILISKMAASETASIKNFSYTLIRWKREIINSFTIIKKRYKEIDKDTGEALIMTRKSRLNNALIENRNRIIKRLKDSANGYRSWERFRNRILYVINDDATYRIMQANIDEK